MCYDASCFANKCAMMPHALLTNKNLLLAQEDDLPRLHKSTGPDRSRAPYSEAAGVRSSKLAVQVHTHTHTHTHTHEHTHAYIHTHTQTHTHTYTQSTHTTHTHTHTHTLFVPHLPGFGVWGLGFGLDWLLEFEDWGLECGVCWGEASLMEVAT
jgi:hypothetical protein